MHSHRGFCMGECTLKAVRGIWNVQLRMPLVCKEVRQISLEAEGGGSKPTMRVVPLVCFGINGSLFEERTPPDVPLIEESRKVSSSAPRKRERNCPQFLPRFKYGVHGQIPRHDFHLMELAHLDGDPGKCLTYAFSAVYDKRLYGESPLGEVGDAPLIHRGRLGHDLLPIQILSGVGIAHDHDTPVSAEEHSVGNDDDRTRQWITGRKPIRV